MMWKCGENKRVGKKFEIKNKEKETQVGESLLKI